ncbi:MAG: MauE/DoxX family redox-associated membrane protein [Desulfobacter sp.]
MTAEKRFSHFRALISWSIRLVLGITFIWASYHKILAPDEFARILYGYGVFPGNLINLMAITVPFVELVAGLCLISGIYRRPGLILINAMLTAFILVIGFNLIRGHEFDCGCFSFGDTQGAASATGLLVRDLLMLGAGLYLWKMFNTQPALPAA